MGFLIAALSCSGKDSVGSQAFLWKLRPYRGYLVEVTKQTLWDGAGFPDTVD